MKSTPLYRQQRAACGKIRSVKFCKPSSSRWALWLFAAALLLKAAMPLLASASAQLQGKTLVEVCTVYGVSLVPLDAQGQEPESGDVSTHGSEHCALTALTALAAPEPPMLSADPMPLRERSAPRAHPSCQAFDACATWVARLKHGPPTVS
jgi:hypothetical protein